MSWIIQGGELVDGITGEITFADGDARIVASWGRNPNETLNNFRTRVVNAAKEYRTALNRTVTRVSIPAQDFD
jgi:hypothetical protein